MCVTGFVQAALWDLDIDPKKWEFEILKTGVLIKVLPHDDGKVHLLVLDYLKKKIKAIVSLY